MSLQRLGSINGRRSALVSTRYEETVQAEPPIPIPLRNPTRLARSRSIRSLATVSSASAASSTHSSTYSSAYSPSASPTTYAPSSRASSYSTYSTYSSPACTTPTAPLIILRPPPPTEQHPALRKRAIQPITEEQDERARHDSMLAPSGGSLVTVQPQPQPDKAGPRRDGATVAAAPAAPLKEACIITCTEKRDPGRERSRSAAAVDHAADKTRHEHEKEKEEKHEGPKGPKDHKDHQDHKEKEKDEDAAATSGVTTAPDKTWRLSRTLGIRPAISMAMASSKKRHSTVESVEAPAPASETQETQTQERAVSTPSTAKIGVSSAKIGPNCPRSSRPRGSSGTGMAKALGVLGASDAEVAGNAGASVASDGVVLPTGTAHSWHGPTCRPSKTKRPKPRAAWTLSLVGSLGARRNASKKPNCTPVVVTPLSPEKPSFQPALPTLPTLPTLPALSALSALPALSTHPCPHPRDPASLLSSTHSTCTSSSCPSSPPLSSSSSSLFPPSTPPAPPVSDPSSLRASSMLDARHTLDHSSRSSRSRREDGSEQPSGSFAPIRTTIPTESLIEDDVLASLSFSHRGSLMLLGRRPSALNRRVKMMAEAEAQAQAEAEVSPEVQAQAAAQQAQQAQQPQQTPPAQPPAQPVAQPDQARPHQRTLSVTTARESHRVRSLYSSEDMRWEDGAVATPFSSAAAAAARKPTLDQDGRPQSRQRPRTQPQPQTRGFDADFPSPSVPPVPPVPSIPPVPPVPSVALPGEAMETSRSEKKLVASPSLSPASPAMSALADRRHLRPRDNDNALDDDDRKRASTITVSTVSSAGLDSMEASMTAPSAETPSASTSNKSVGSGGNGNNGNNGLLNINYRRRGKFEYAGGIEDWEDIDGVVDRFGFIHARRPHTSGGESLAPPPSRMSQMSQMSGLSGSGMPPGSRGGRSTRRAGGGFLSAPSRKPSSRSLHTQASTTATMTEAAKLSLRAAANRLPHNRDRRWVDEAGEMLAQAPNGLDDIAEEAQAERLADALKRKEAVRSEKWLRMAHVERGGGGGTDYVFDLRHPKLVERTWKGIPDCWRAAAWYSFLASSARRARGTEAADEPPLDDDAALIAAFHRLQLSGSPDDVQIDLDVPRTVSGHVMFRRRYRGGQRLLFRVLHALSLFCARGTGGYVQGMASLAATLLCYYDEERCFVMLVRVFRLRGLERLYAPGFSGLITALENFDRHWLARNSQQAARKLETLGIDTMAYATRWYLTLFNLSVPFAAQLRIWDVFMLLGGDEMAGAGTETAAAAAAAAAEGLASPGDLSVLHATSAALVDALQDVLADADFENAMKALTSWIPIRDEDLLMRVVRAEWKRRDR